MLCSKCSEVVKPVVAVDIDGTLADYHSHFLTFAANYLGMEGEELGMGGEPPMNYDGIRPFKAWFKDHYSANDATWADIKLAYRQGGMKRSLPLYDYARELCASIRGRGAELWLTTTRPYLRLDGVDPDTRFWLSRHSIEYDGLLYDEFKYQRLADRIDRTRVVAVLDDLPEMFDSAARLFGWQVPILRRTKWNAGVVPEGAQAVDTLLEAKGMILHRVWLWQEAQDV
jgi:hypothetical protein